MKDSVRIVVVGDAKVGKTSIIEVLITATFEEEVQAVLPVLVVPKDVTPERVHVEIVDTPGAESEVSKVHEELKKADVIVLVYSVNDEDSQRRIGEYWLKKFRAQSVNVPIILVGNKIDTRGGITDPSAAAKMEAFIKPIMDTHREVDVCIECSAKTVSNISEVFYFAQKAVLHPTGPLYDVDKHSLKPPAIAALKRIFQLCDTDGDGGLNDQELNAFQYTCFNVHLAPEELEGVKKVVQENRPKNGIRPDGSISVEGFVFLHTLFVQKGRLETTWIVLRKFGYDDEMRLSLPAQSMVKRTDDQSVELSKKGKDFLTKVFASVNEKKDGALSPAELKSAFADHPDGAFFVSSETPVGERLTELGVGEKKDCMNLTAFLARWAMYIHESPNDALLSLMYLGYGEEPSTAVSVTKSRKRDRYNRTISREVFHILVLGDDYAEKSDIIRGLSGQSAIGKDSPGMAAVATISDETKKSKTIFMKDGRFITPKNLESQSAAIERADVICIAFDGSSESSWDYAKSLWNAVKFTAEIKLPVVFVCSLEKVEGDSPILGEADALCEEYSLPSPVRVSLRDGENGNLYQDLLGVALTPQVACPDYFESAKSDSSAAATALQVAAGTLVVSGVLYGAKRLYDYYASKPSSN